LGEGSLTCTKVALEEEHIAGVKILAKVSAKILHRFRGSHNGHSARVIDLGMREGPWSPRALLVELAPKINPGSRT
jgi:hypothetical protein